jgi:hypothetical protein
MGHDLAGFTEAAGVVSMAEPLGQEQRPVQGRLLREQGRLRRWMWSWS